MSDIGLSQFQLFSRLSPAQLEKLSGMSTQSAFGPGEVLFEEQTPAQYVYAVLEGSVDLSIVFRDHLVQWDVKHEESVFKTVKDIESQIVIETIEAGQDLGWSALVKPYRWTATARAVSPARVLLLSAPDLRAELDSDPGLGYAVTKSLSEIISQRLRQRTGRLIELWGEYFDFERI